MADVTQNTFDETKKYVKTIFQRGRNVLDSELNELQDDARVNFYREMQVVFGTDLVVKSAVSFAITGGTNQITIAAGIGSAYGYIISQASPINVTGLTTPGGARTDCVWLSISESEIDSVADPAIATAALGETTRRSKLVIGWGVTENSLVPPANTGEPWAVGVVYIRVALLSRIASVTIDSSMIYDRKQLFRQYIGSLSADFVPITSYLYDDVSHSNVDRLGFDNFGAVGNWREDWSWKASSGSSDYAARNYTFLSNGTGSALRDPPVAGIEFGTGITIRCGVGEASGKYAQVKQNWLISPNTKTLFAIEWSVIYGGTEVAGFGAATTQIFRCGLADTLTTGVPSVAAAYFEWSGPSLAEWNAKVVGASSSGAFTAVSGGTAPRHFRIEIIGSAADSLSASRVNFYIDNRLVDSNTSSYPSTGTLGFFCSAVSTGTTVIDTMVISDVRAAWRRMVTPSKR